MWADFAASDAGGPLKIEDLLAAIKAVEDDTSVHPCSLGQHMVSAGGMRALRAGGHTRCADCGSLL